MPLLLSKQIDEQSAYAIWKISETTEQLQLLHNERPEESFHPNKKGEWLATRMLISNLCSKFGIEYHGIKKDAYGKPFLINSKAQISLSHSFPIASAMIHRSKPCGLDVEWPREKMNRIQKKFLHAEEQHYRDNQTALCVIWAAKEAIYKQYGKENLSFKENIIIDLKEKMIVGRIEKNDLKEYVPLTLEKIKGYFLVYSR